MGFRFRKSVKLAPGVRLNVGKKSVGVSLGGKGFRHSINSSGRRTTTVGVPGTGLSYSHSHSYNKTKNNLSKSNTLNTKNASLTKGEIDSLNTYRDTNSPIYTVHQYEKQVLRLSQWHLKLIKPIDWAAKANKKPPFHIGDAGKNEEAANKLLKDYKPSFFEKVFKRDQAKINKLQDLVKEAIEKDKDEYKQWLNVVEQAKKFKDARSNQYIELLKQSNFFEVEGEANVSIKPLINNEELSIDLFISDQIIPEVRYSLTKTGKLSTKKETKTNYFNLYQRFACSIILKIVKDTFNILPNVEKVLINVMEEKVDPADGYEKVYLLIQVSVSRNELMRLNFEMLNPVAAIEAFKPQWKYLKTKGFQPLRAYVSN